MASTQAVALANIIMPVDRLISVELRATRADFLAFAAASADLRRMEKDFPGATQYIWKSMEAEVRRLSAESHASLIGDMAAIYAAGLNQDEIAVVTRFYQTPTGQRALERLYGAADFDSVAGAIRKAGHVTSDTQAAAYAESLSLAATAITPADRDALVALNRAVNPEKLARVSTALQKRIVERANAAMQARNARLAKISFEASKRWVEQARSRR